jgi:hypothetical protein
MMGHENRADFFVRVCFSVAVCALVINARAVAQSEPAVTAAQNYVKTLQGILQNANVAPGAAASSTDSNLSNRLLEINNSGGKSGRAPISGFCLRSGTKSEPETCPADPFTNFPAVKSLGTPEKESGLFESVGKCCQEIKNSKALGLLSFSYCDSAWCFGTAALPRDPALSKQKSNAAQALWNFGFSLGGSITQSLASGLGSGSTVAAGQAQAAKNEFSEANDSLMQRYSAALEKVKAGQPVKDNALSSSVKNPIGPIVEAGEMMRPHLAQISALLDQIRANGINIANLTDQSRPNSLTTGLQEFPNAVRDVVNANLSGSQSADHLVKQFQAVDSDIPSTTVVQFVELWVAASRELDTTLNQIAQKLQVPGVAKEGEKKPKKTRSSASEDEYGSTGGGGNGGMSTGDAALMASMMKGPDLSALQKKNEDDHDKDSNNSTPTTPPTTPTDTGNSQTPPPAPTFPTTETQTGDPVCPPNYTYNGYSKMCDPPKQCGAGQTLASDGTCRYAEQTPQTAPTGEGNSETPPAGTGSPTGPQPTQIASVPPQAQQDKRFTPGGLVGGNNPVNTALNSGSGQQRVAASNLPKNSKKEENIVNPNVHYIASDSASRGSVSSGESGYSEGARNLASAGAGNSGGAAGSQDGGLTSGGATGGGLDKYERDPFRKLCLGRSGTDWNACAGGMASLMSEKYL